MTPRSRREFGPMTLAEVLAAREGERFEGRSQAADRPLIIPRDERGQASGTGRVANVSRSDDEGALIVDGYATVFDVGYDMYGGPSRYGWTEYVATGAATKTLSESPDVVFLVNHDGLPLARTKSGTLELSADSHGLHSVAHCDRSDPDVQKLEPKMERGDLDEMSFAFRIVRQEWNEDYTERFITEFSIDRGDTSIVTFGANPHTHAHLRGVDELLAQLVDVDLDEAMAQVRAADAGTDLRALHDALSLLLAEDDPAPQRMTVSQARQLV